MRGNGLMWISSCLIGYRYCYHGVLLSDNLVTVVDVGTFWYINHTFQVKTIHSSPDNLALRLFALSWKIIALFKFYGSNASQKRAHLKQTEAKRLYGYIRIWPFVPPKTAFLVFTCELFLGWYSFPVHLWTALHCVTVSDHRCVLRLAPRVWSYWL